LDSGERFDLGPGWCGSREKTRRIGRKKSNEAAFARSVSQEKEREMSRLGDRSHGVATRLESIGEGNRGGRGGDSLANRSSSTRERVLSFFFRGYRKLIAPVFGALGVQCRFEPSCSHYAEEAIVRYGWKGVAMAIARLLRCHPGHPGGFDPVP
jgi:putative membrane protein insertion efficiency factor